MEKQILELHTFLSTLFWEAMPAVCWVDKRIFCPPSSLKCAFSESTEELHWSITAIGVLFQPPLTWFSNNHPLFPFSVGLGLSPPGFWTTQETFIQNQSGATCQARGWGYRDERDTKTLFSWHCWWTKTQTLLVMWQRIMWAEQRGSTFCLVARETSWKRYNFSWALNLIISENAVMVRRKSAIKCLWSSSQIFCSYLMVHWVPSTSCGCPWPDWLKAPLNRASLRKL